MSDKGVKVGCYKYKNGGDNDNGRLIHIKSLTKQFVEVDVYNFYDNRSSLTDVKEHPSSKIKSFKKKKIGDNGHLFINTCVQWWLDDEHYIGSNDGVEENGFCGNCLTIKPKNTLSIANLCLNNCLVEEEQPPSPDDGTAEYDEDEQDENEYKKEIERWCPKRHITEWGNYGYNYKLDKKWVKEVLDFLDTTYLNNSLYENRIFVRELLTNNDRIYERDVVKIDRFVEFLKTDFMTTNVFLDDKIC